MNFKALLVSYLIVLSFTGFSQDRSGRLKQLSIERHIQYLSQQEKAANYAREHNVPLSFTDSNGTHILLTGIDEWGKPVYRATFNAEAAITTGASRLHTGGELGLGLEGEGIMVGIWDGGKVKKNHVEFGNRILSVQGDSESFHATHVAGTILASGVNTMAKGMAPKATAVTWYFDNDETEIASLAAPDQSSLLFSNHSYGILLGWWRNNGTWVWNGNPAISASEDYRFGLYTARSNIIDDIAFNAPYYTLVWAAGNDRGSTGDGTYPPDGNGGTGYDCLHPDAVAKNIITVGAIEKNTDYTGPSSVIMSNFSSWGPTDDGRIKPDLVGAGVNVYSTNLGANTYSYESGTSMAAPNVTGSLVLLQELYKNLHAGDYMRAATLKALAIHTAKEAGSYPGPDYSFGWGLLDVDSAAKVLLAEDQRSVIVSENTLDEGQIFEFVIDPKQNTPIIATIVWTDPAGTPVATPVLDPSISMLVNDLDIRIVDDANNQIYPWVLNRINPTYAATNGDNTVDNVEKIEFLTPEPRIYKLRVTHKGAGLAYGKQDYSLILTYTPAGDTRTAYYWIGDSGNWTDPGKWSLSSGGMSAGQVPDVNSRVIFDENSFSGTDDLVTLPANVTCGSLTWLAKGNSGLSLNGHTVFVNGNLTVSPYEFSIRSAGTIAFTGGFSPNSQINLGGTDFSLADVIINSDDQVAWTLNGAVNAGSITVEKGNLIAKNTTIRISRLTASDVNAPMLDLTGTDISNVTELSISGPNIDLKAEGTVIRMKSDAITTIDWNDVNYNGSLHVDGGQLNFTGNANIDELILDGGLILNGNNTIRKFEASSGSSIQFQSGTRQSFTDTVLLNATSTDKIFLSTVGGGISEIFFNGHFKSCFDYLDISNVNMAPGAASVTAGLHSTLSNSFNWAVSACEEVLFPDFSVHYNCENSITEFINSSEGNINSYTWNFGDPSSPENISNDPNPGHIYMTTGIFPVELTISDGITSKTYSMDVEIIDNNLDANSVVLSNEKLFSFQLAPEYQWFKNNEPIEGAISRSYDYNGDQGIYFVLVKNATCNIPSASFVISSAEEEIDQVESLSIFPNPAIDELTIKIPGHLLPAQLAIINSMGQQVHIFRADAEITNLELTGIPDGLYVLNIESTETVKTKLVIKRE